jgi:hypothetical protein
MSELAYRHPGRGKAHREKVPRRTLCDDRRHAGWERVPADQVPPADLCKRCWPERAS